MPIHLAPDLLAALAIPLALGASVWVAQLFVVYWIIRLAIRAELGRRER